MASTTREKVLRFELQMAQQARKLGGRLAELRDERDWKQKDVVAAMAELGDLSLNTNQLSRYENGGAFPSEKRLERFAAIFETEVADLLAGPTPERKKPSADMPADDDRLSQVEQKLDRVLEWMEARSAEGAEDDLGQDGDRKPQPSEETGE